MVFLSKPLELHPIVLRLIVGDGHQPIVALHRLEFAVLVGDVDLKDQVQVQDDKPSEREDEMVKISDVEHLETLPNHM